MGITYGRSADATCMELRNFYEGETTETELSLT
jgi:hypothetical protein